MTRHFNFGTTPVTKIREIIDLAFLKVSAWCCLLNACNGAADIACLARTTPKQALQWRRNRQAALHQAPDRVEHVAIDIARRARHMVHRCRRCKGRGELMGGGG